MRKTIVLVILGMILIACAGKDGKGDIKKSKKSDTVNVIDGKKIYKQNCVICHGMDGKLGINNSKDLTVSEMDLEERVAIITNGKGTMTPFNTLLSEAKIQAVAEFSMTLK